MQYLELETNLRTISAKQEFVRKEKTPLKEIIRRQEEGYSTSSEADTASELDNIAELKENLHKKNTYIKQLLGDLEVSAKINNTY